MQHDKEIETQTELTRLVTCYEFLAKKVGELCDSIKGITNDIAQISHDNTNMRVKNEITSIGIDNIRVEIGNVARDQHSQHQRIEKIEQIQSNWWFGSKVAYSLLGIFSFFFIAWGGIQLDSINKTTNKIHDIEIQLIKIEGDLYGNTKR
jgi:hypothetical protein